MRVIQDSGYPGSSDLYGIVRDLPLHLSAGWAPTLGASILLVLLLLFHVSRHVTAEGHRSLFNNLPSKCRSSVAIAGCFSSSKRSSFGYGTGSILEWQRDLARPVCGVVFLFRESVPGQNLLM